MRDVARVFQSTERDIHWLLEQLFLAQFFLWLFLCRWFFPRLQKDLLGTAYQVATLIRQGSLALRHLVPEAAQGIVREELYDIPWGKKLVPYRQFPAIARRRRVGAHLPTFFLRIVVLIYPTNRFIFGPEWFDLRVIDQIQQCQ